ncbi:MAG TPA: hypothetical protein VIW67_14745 [Terriglobales bacterium]|jgi:hypothetical protein
MKKGLLMPSLFATALMSPISYASLGADGGPASSNGWSEPSEIAVLSKDWSAKAITRTCQYQWIDAKGGVNLKSLRMVLVTTSGQLWLGDSAYTNLVVFPSRMIGFRADLGAKLLARPFVEKLPELNRDEILRERLDKAIKQASAEDPFFLRGDSLPLRAIFPFGSLERNPYDASNDPLIVLKGMEFQDANLVLTILGENGALTTLTINPELEVNGASLNGTKVEIKEKIKFSGGHASHPTIVNRTPWKLALAELKSQGYDWLEVSTNANLKAAWMKEVVDVVEKEVDKGTISDEKADEELARRTKEFVLKKIKPKLKPSSPSPDK